MAHRWRSHGGRSDPGRDAVGRCIRARSVLPVRAEPLSSVLLSLVALPLSPVGAGFPGTDAAPIRVALRDADGDGVEDVLERRLRKAAAGVRHAVVVATD